MALLHLPLDAITEQPLRALIETGARESLYIDYKRETYGGNDAARKEFLADICSFANAAGGDIVIGMAENAGVPSEIMPFTDDADQERLRLEQMARDGIEPRIIGLAVRLVPVSGGGVFVIRVPKSYNPPHRVTFKNSKRFYARSSGGKYEPDIGELRNLFLAAPHLHERIREFRMGRIARIAAGETPVPLCISLPRYAVLHVVPFSAFGGFGHDLIAKFGRHWQEFWPFRSDRPAGTLVNFDGIITHSGARGEMRKYFSYCQIFRSGSVETTEAFGDNGMTREDLFIAGLFNGHNAGAQVRNSVFRLASALSKCGVMPPYVVMFSLLGMKDAKLGVPGLLQVADRDQYHFIEVQLDTVPESPEAAGQDLIPLLDHIASLSGAISSWIAPNAQLPSTGALE